MSKIFSAYQEALQKYSARVVEVSQAINDNRAAYASALEKYQAAVLDDADASAHESEMAGLNAELEILTRKADALNSVSKKGANSTIRSAAQEVFRVNQKEIVGMQAQYDQKKQALLAMQTEYLNGLVEIGNLARASSTLREECNLAMTDAQLSIGVAALGDELGGLLSRRKGWVFIDPDFVARAFTSGELPPDTTFAGVADTPPVKEKIRTDSGDVRLPRIYRTAPKKPVEPDTVA